MKIKKKKKKERKKVFFFCWRHANLSETEKRKRQGFSGAFGAAPLDENHTHTHKRD